MKAYVPYHPAHPGTYALHKLGCGSGISSKLDATHLARVFRVALRFALLFILILFTACGSSRKSVEVQSINQAQEHEVRLSYGQSLFALFDSLAAVQILEADSLEMEFFDAADMGIRNDSLAATRPPQSQAPGRLAARLKVKGIRSNTQLTHTQTSGAENVSVDTASTHRFGHEQVTESNVTEKEVKPPNTFLNLAVLVMAIAILLGVALFAIGKFKW